MKKTGIAFIMITFMMICILVKPILVNADEQVSSNNIEIKYEYNSKKNTVLAEVVSTEPLKETKKSWELSEDKLSYTYEFKENTSYSSTFEDIYGNKKNIKIDITQIDMTGPILSIKYEYNSEKNTVTAIVSSNEVLAKTKKSWELSKDKLSYTYEFKENTTYTTTFEDIYGNNTSIKIKINQIQKNKLEVSYNYNQETNTVRATVKSKEQLAKTKKSWKLSKDKLSYTYEFTDNTNYTTTFEDISGNKYDVNINITQIDKEGPELKIKYNYIDETNSVNVVITANEKLLNNKISWKLSEDKLKYEYEFKENTTYLTSFADIYGNKTSIKINVTQINNIYNGIDVSSHQGTIDWAKVKSSGIDYAIIRAGFRGYGSTGSLNVDSYFETNTKNAILNGIDIGIYFYSQAITVEEAVEEANFVLKLIEKYNIKIKYPIAIDTEKTLVGNGRADSISKSLRTDICIAFCKTIENAGYKSMIYANKYWFLNNLELDRLQKYDIWLAHYVNETDYKYSYVMWQYTSTGSIEGIGGTVDKSYCYKKY